MRTGGGHSTKSELYECMFEVGLEVRGESGKCGKLNTKDVSRGRRIKFRK